MNKSYIIYQATQGGHYVQENEMNKYASVLFAGLGFIESLYES